MKGTLLLVVTGVGLLSFGCDSSPGNSNAADAGVADVDVADVADVAVEPREAQLDLYHDAADAGLDKRAQDACEPQCADLLYTTVCGDDGCGGNCGTCDVGLECTNGACSTGGCVPNCNGRLCGHDGCGGTCGTCAAGLECMQVLGQSKCTQSCQPGGCSEGQNCIFGVCVIQQCQQDSDCGSEPNYYCDKYKQCEKYVVCADSGDCNFYNKESYCDQEHGVCRPDGDCGEDKDCAQGACTVDHWCQIQTCGLTDSLCPPFAPICSQPAGSGECLLVADCGACVAPCVFDSECPAGEVCEDSICRVWEYSEFCILDTDCPADNYCHPGCAPLPAGCVEDGDCQEGHVCVAAHCSLDELLPCSTDEHCATMYEGYTCLDGWCQRFEGCLTDDQCAQGQYCGGGGCAPIPDLPDCKDDLDCSEGLVCNIGNGLCAVPPQCLFSCQCAAGYVCQDQICYNDSGVCAWIEKGPDFCNDGDPNTTDSCDEALGCVHTVVDQ